MKRILGVATAGVLVAAVLGVFVFASASSAQVENPAGSGARNMYTNTETTLPPSDNPGRDLYQQSCSTCHGKLAEGSPDGPPLLGVGAASVDFFLSTGRMPLSHPQAQAPRGKPRYDEAQRAAIVAYVAGLSDGPPIPDVDPAKGNLAEGNLLFANNCAACHHSQGSGGALLGGRYAPSLHPSTALQIAEAIRIGPGGMPKYGPETFDQHQLNSLVAYVQHLQTSKDAGGYDVGKLGPVSEGFFAWIVGLGAMLALARWIGTRV